MQNGNVCVECHPAVAMTKAQPGAHAHIQHPGCIDCVHVVVAMWRLYNKSTMHERSSRLGDSQLVTSLRHIKMHKITF